MTCSNCGEPLEIGSWPFCPHGPARQYSTAAHPSERTVVWQHPVTGQVRYPGRNDTPIPERYVEQGYVRREMSTLREVQQFERERGVHNEAVWFDRGSGRDFG